MKIETLAEETKEELRRLEDKIEKLERWIDVEKRIKLHAAMEKIDYDYYDSSTNPRERKIHEITEISKYVLPKEETMNEMFKYIDERIEDVGKKNKEYIEKHGPTFNEYFEKYKAQVKYIREIYNE